MNAQESLDKIKNLQDCINQKEKLINSFNAEIEEICIDGIVLCYVTSDGRLEITDAGDTFLSDAAAILPVAHVVKDENVLKLGL